MAIVLLYVAAAIPWLAPVSFKGVWRRDSPRLQRVSHRQSVGALEAENGRVLVAWTGCGLL